MSLTKDTPTRVNQIGRAFELSLGQDLTQSPYYNDDIAPTLVSERTWGAKSIAALWVGMSICVPTYTLGGVLTSYFGLSVTEALLTILIANIIVLIPLTLNAAPGTTYGIPFPVLLRASFGLKGSNLPCLTRAIVACGWFGIQTLFGGLAIHLLFSQLIPGWEELGSSGEVVGFFIFLTLNLVIVLKGTHAIKTLEVLSAPLLLLTSLALMAYALPEVNLSDLIDKPATRAADESVWPYFLSGLTAMVGFWATLSLNIPDFSRYAKSQKAQITGQLLGLPLTMFFFASLGVIMTAASSSLVGETVSDPVTLVGKIDNTVVIAISMVIIIIATLSTNTAANVVSPANDFQNIAPQKINHRKGVLLTGAIAVVIMSWELLRKLDWVVSDLSIESLFTGWLLGYSSLLGPIAGVMIVDYFVVKKQRLALIDLYTEEGQYPLYHWPGLVAFIAPVAMSIYALLSGHLGWFYDYGWFTGSFSGGMLYWLLSVKRT